MLRRWGSIVSGWLWANPAKATLLLMGIGGAGVAAIPFNTPALLPQMSVNLSQANAFTPLMSAALKPNNGSAGSFLLPTTPMNSWFWSGEFQTDTNAGIQYLGGIGAGQRGIFLTGRNGGPSILGVQSLANSTNWWTATSAVNVASSSISYTPKGSGYTGGLHTFTGIGGGVTSCDTNGAGGRQPTGWVEPGTAGTANYMDPGILCGPAPTVNPALISGMGATQTPSATTCASNTPVTGQIEITVTTPVEHGFNPSDTFFLGGYTTTALNAGYIATGAPSPFIIKGTTASTGTCPGSITIGSGTIGAASGGVGGSAAVITFPAPALAAFANNISTGITIQPGQRVCLAFGQLGKDSEFPGATFAIGQDYLGNQLQGSPFVNPWLNQGNAKIFGTVTTGTQSPSTPALTMSFSNFAVTAASFSTASGHATFTTSVATNYIEGSEFEISGSSTTGGGTFDLDYVAVAGTTGTTVVARPLSGRAGVPQTSALTNSSVASAGSMMSVVLPGMVMAGTTPANLAILPYGTFGSTGRGGPGTYALSGNPTVALGPGTLFLSGNYFGSANSGTGVWTPTAANTTIGDFVNVLGNELSTGAVVSPPIGWGGSFGNIGMFWGQFPNVNGLLTNAGLDNLCRKKKDFQTWAATDGAGGVWHSFLPLNDGGTFADAAAGQFQGHTTGASGSTATLTIDAVTTTAAAPSGTVSICGPGIPGSPTACPTITASGAFSAAQTYTLTWATAIAANVGSSGSPIALSASAIKPAVVVSPNQVTASIGGTGNKVLTVTDWPNKFTGTGVLSGSWPTNTTLTFTGGTGTLAVGQCFRDGNVVIADTQPLCVLSVAGSVATVGPNYYTNASDALHGAGIALTGSVSTVTPGMWVTGAGITTPVQIISYGANTIGGLGTYGLAHGLNGAIGSETMVVTTVSPAGAISPGSAMDVVSLRWGTVFPLTNISTGVGSVILDGNYDVALGTPSAVQALITNWVPPLGQAPTPLAGCSACDWTDMTGGTIAAGRWSGSATSIPAGGPYYAFVRPKNSQTWVLSPNALFVGHTLAAIGNGNGSSQLVNNGNGSGPGYATKSWLVGFGQSVGFTTGGVGNNLAITGNATFGPPITGNVVPGAPASVLSERFGTYASPSTTMTFADGAAAIVEAGGQLSGSPISLVAQFRDGTSTNIFWSSNAPQSITVGVGDGTTTNFSSGPAFGGTPGAGFSQAMTATVSIAGVVSAATFGGNQWAFLQAGQKMTCLTACGGYTSGVLLSKTLLSPSPGTAITAGTWTVTGNNLEYNQALLTGATATVSISGATLTVSSIIAGQLAPNQILSNVSGAPTLQACTAGCGAFAGGSGTIGAPSTSTWTLSSSAGAGFSGTAFFTPPAGVAMQPSIPTPDIVPIQSPNAFTAIGAGMFVKHGTFQLFDNGTLVCSDTTAFSYTVQAGSCVGAGIASSWINYTNKQYSINFITAPASGHPLIATWNNLVTGDSTGGWEQLDWVDDTVAAAVNRTGGVDGYLNLMQGLQGTMPNLDLMRKYEYMMRPGGRMSKLHNGSAAPIAAFFAGMPRSQGPVNFYGGQGNTGANDWEAASDDAVRESIFNATLGSISGSGLTATGVLTLTSSASGEVWEQMVLECWPRSLTCALPAGSEITGLRTGTWGANGSTYDVVSNTLSGLSAIASPIQLHNAFAWEAGIAGYVGPQNDLGMRGGLSGMAGAAVETSGGAHGALKFGHRTAVLFPAVYKQDLTIASNPTVSRTIPSTSPCVSTAAYMPCLDDATGGVSYPASHAATWSGSTVTITGGLAAGDRPFVIGHKIGCAGCNAVYITSLSVPPTQSTVAGAGEVGQTFTFGTSGAIGGTGAGTITGNCANNGAGTASCIDIVFDIKTAGTYGTAAALNTCGVNNLQGVGSLPTAATYTFPNGQCKPEGIGSLTRGFRIGSAQLLNNPTSQVAGSPYDDGADPGPGGGVTTSVTLGEGLFNQSQAFTCHIVAALTSPARGVVQCVHGVVYGTNGLFSSIGTWAANTTYLGYGDAYALGGRVGGLVGTPGGQSLPVTAGAFYPDGQWVAGGVCTLVTGTAPVASAMGFTTSGGVLTAAYPAGVGTGASTQCTYPLSFTFTATISGWNAGTLKANMTAVSGLGTNTIVPGETLSWSGGVGGSSNTIKVFNSIGSGLGTGTTVITCATTCSGAAVTVTSGPTAGSGGAITTPPIEPIEGVAGIATYNSDNNFMGTLLFDNSGLVGNPYGGRFQHSGPGTYEAPGNAAKPFGARRGLRVSG